MSNPRQLVLQSFKKLHRTRMKVFDGDLRALMAARLKVNEEYKKNKLVSDVESIKAMVQFAEDVEEVLKTQVIQARQVQPGVYKARITEETLKVENVPFNPNTIPDEVVPGPQHCCQDKASK